MAVLTRICMRDRISKKPSNQLLVYKPRTNIHPPAQFFFLPQPSDFVEQSAIEEIFH